MSEWTSAHPPDDAEYETWPEPANRVLPALAALALAIGIGVYLLGQWLQPPVVVFPAVPILMPNRYELPVCTGNKTCNVVLTATPTNQSTFTTWTSSGTGAGVVATCLAGR